MTSPLRAWLSLVGAIVVLLVVDLLLVHRTAHVITIKEAAIESAVWIVWAVSFSFFAVPRQYQFRVLF